MPEIICARADGLGQKRLFGVLQMPIFDVAGHPETGKIVYSAQVSVDPLRTRIFLMNIDGSGMQGLTDGTQNDGSLQWFPNGKRIAFVSWSRDPDNRPHVFSLDIETREVVQHASVLPEVWTMAPVGDNMSIAVTPGQYLGIRETEEGPDTELVVISTLEQQEVLDQLTRNDTDERSPVYSETARALACVSTAGGNSKLDVYYLNGGDPYTVATDTTIAHPYWSPDGHRISYINGDGKVVIVDIITKNRMTLDTTQLTGSIKIPSNTVSSMAWVTPSI